MSNIIGFKHIFANDEYIHPAFHEPAQQEGDTGYDYYYLLYPTGLALILNINQVVDDNVFTYIPSTNSFVCNGYGLDTVNAKLRIRSITPKTYQIEGYSNNILHRNILASADSWTAGSGYSGTERHSFGCRRSSNPVYIDQSNGKVQWAGEGYDKIDTIMFIDPALGVGQELVTSSVDTNRYPLYKKNNLYYVSTTTKQPNAQYLCAAGDCFLHSDTLTALNQGWTKGYASRKKFYGSYSSNLNPQVPGSSTIFPEGSRDDNTADSYHTDKERFLTNKFGIKDGNNGYQLSTAPALAGSGGYYIGTDSNKESYSQTEVTKDDPGVLFRNDEDYYEGVHITQKDIFFIDQFIVQIKGNHFKIPLNGRVEYYHREGTATTCENALANTDSKTLFKRLTKSSGFPEEYAFSPTDQKKGFGLERGLGVAETWICYNRKYTDDTMITVELPQPQCGVGKYNRNTQSGVTSQTTTERFDKTFTLTLDYHRAMRQSNPYHRQMLQTADLDSYNKLDPTTLSISINYIINIPIIPGIALNDLPEDSNYAPGKTGLQKGKDRKEIIDDSGYVNAYLDYRTSTGGTAKSLFEIYNTFNIGCGIVTNFNFSLLTDNTPAIMEVYDENYNIIETLVDARSSVDSGNVAGFSARITSESQPFIDVVIAYPEE